MARNWADLPPELLRLCSQHLCPNGLSAFRAVCHSWQSASVEERSDVPWLMLANEKVTGKQKQRCGFFCLPCQRVHKKLLPEAKARRCFASRGWVLTVGRDSKLHILNNPMSSRGHIIKLPNLNMFPDLDLEVLDAMYPHVYGDFIAKFVLSDSPTKSPNYRVMVIYRNNERLGFWKPGDEEWTAVTSPRSHYFDVIFYEGCFYALKCDGCILRCDVDGPTPYKAQVVFATPQRLLGCDWDRAYLVQSTTGSLLVVSRRWRQRKSRGTFRFHVYEIDLETQSFKGVKTLKNAALFLGWNSSFSLEVDERHPIKPNCIYFTDDFLDSSRHTKDGGGKDMGIYHLEDGTIEPHFRGKSYHHYSPPLWIEPNF